MEGKIVPPILSNNEQESEICSRLTLLLENFEHIVEECLEGISLDQLKAHGKVCQDCHEILQSGLGRCLIQIIKNIKRR